MKLKLTIGATLVSNKIFIVVFLVEQQIRFSTRKMLKGTAGHELDKVLATKKKWRRKA